MNTDADVVIEAPRIESLPALLFAGSVARYDSKAPTGIPEQWQHFGPHIPAFPGRDGDAAYGICHNFDNEGHFDYMCGVTISETQDLPEGMSSLPVPAATYAVFAHKGHIAEIRNTLAAIWMKYIPASNLKPTNSPMFERYGPEFNPLTGLGGLEIWIPIER